MTEETESGKTISGAVTKACEIEKAKAYDASMLLEKAFGLAKHRIEGMDCGSANLYLIDILGQAHSMAASMARRL